MVCINYGREQFFVLYNRKRCHHSGETLPSGFAQQPFNNQCHICQRWKKHPSRMQMFYLLLACFTLSVKAWEVLDDHFAPWSLSSRPFSGPQHWRLEEIWQCRSTSLGADELCCGPEDSLWFSLSRFPDIQNDTKLCTRTNTSNLKVPAISSYLVVA